MQAMGFGEEAERVTTRQLIIYADKFNSKDVILQGEVIGDIMRRGDFVWFNLQDDFNVMGIWASQNIVGEITTLGDYRHKGDTVEVKGKFLKADPELKGELCVRAQKINVVRQGYKIFYIINPLKVQIALALMLAVLALGLLKFSMRKRFV